MIACHVSNGSRWTKSLSWFNTIWGYESKALKTKTFNVELAHFFQGEYNNCRTKSVIQVDDERCDCIDVYRIGQIQNSLEKIIENPGRPR